MSQISLLFVFSVILMIPSGLANADTVPTPGDDVITGTEGFDKIDSGDGDDVIFGLGGDDELRGGDGSDEIFGGDGDDDIHGGDDNDYLDAGDGDDRHVHGDKGDDQLILGNGNDEGKGGDGNDDIDGGPGDDNIDGQKGDDYINGGSGNDLLKGGDGNDVIEGGEGDDELRSGKKGVYDYLSGGPGDDLLKAEEDTKTPSNSIVIFDGGEEDEIFGDVCFFDGGPGFINYPGDTKKEYEGNDIIVGGQGDGSTCEKLIIISTGVDILAGTVNLTPTVIIDSPSAGEEFEIDVDTVTLGVSTASDPEDGQLDVEWSIDGGAALVDLGSEATDVLILASVANDLGLGAHVITATVTAPTGSQVATDTVAITVIDEPAAEDTFRLSDNAGFTNDIRTFSLGSSMFLKVTTNTVDFDNMKKAEFEIKSVDDKNTKIKANLTHLGGGVFTAEVTSTDLTTEGFTVGETATVKLKLEDQNKQKLEFKNIIISFF